MTLCGCFHWWQRVHNIGESKKHVDGETMWKGWPLPTMGSVAPLEFFLNLSRKSLHSNALLVRKCAPWGAGLFTPTLL